jgi:hypothetical protein
MSQIKHCLASRSPVDVHKNGMSAAVSNVVFRRSTFDVSVSTLTFDSQRLIATSFHNCYSSVGARLSTKQRRVVQRCAPAGFADQYFNIDSAPLLIPSGEWKEVPGSVLAPKGFRGNGIYSGMRAGAKGDIALVVCDNGAVAAGTFTQNVMCAAPVTVCKQVLAQNDSSIKAVRCCPAEHDFQRHCDEGS